MRLRYRYVDFKVRGWWGVGMGEVRKRPIVNERSGKLFVVDCASTHRRVRFISWAIHTVVTRGAGPSIYECGQRCRNALCALPPVNTVGLES
jgi:hypothetical protein